ncbi:MAG: metal ABC transporter substrate-binding protein [Bacteroidota bacterium]
MKKSWYLMSLLLLVVVFIGWSLLRQSEVEVADSSKLQVTVSLPLLRNLTEAIGRDQVAVTSIIEGPSCNHHYEPASGDLVNVSRSPIFIKAGMGFDLWVDKLIEGAGEDVMVIDVSKGVTLIDAEHHSRAADEDDEADSDHEHLSGNPHYWGNPENVKIMAENILKGLIKALPEKEEYFTENYREYLTKVDQTVGRLQAELDGVSNKKIISYSAAFPYLYQYFGFDNLATVESTCEQEVSPRRLAEVIKIIKTNQVKVVIGEAVYPKLPENLAQETGATLVLLWPSTNETGDYLETLSENIEKMVAALE